MKRFSFILAGLLAISTLSFAQEQKTEDKKQEIKIYNPNADARADLKAAVTRAKKLNKHVFVMVGGNWCSWCLAFHHLVDNTPELKSYLDGNYETVLLNYSKENKNEAVLASLSHPERFGFPVFVILDGNGKLLHTENSAYLEEGKGHNPKKVLDFLKNWNYTALDPATYAKESTSK
ncbi:thioredoxin family protein [Pedobacter sp. L105]|uniref:thioredoxin family protein n=1 Tax=Pedobacter sp. L105 TaxID=1641871 RepID=UPI00131B8B01|nr:thioredoxin family protein [Pedobacter sp. L105]